MQFIKVKNHISDRAHTTTLINMDKIVAIDWYNWEIELDNGQKCELEGTMEMFNFDRDEMLDGEEKLAFIIQKYLTVKI